MISLETIIAIWPHFLPVFHYEELNAHLSGYIRHSKKLLIPKKKAKEIQDLVALQSTLQSWTNNQVT